MRLSGILAVLALVVVLLLSTLSVIAFTSGATAGSAATTTKTSSTTTSSKSFVFFGHSPVDMLVIDPNGNEIGCASEPCTLFPPQGLVDTILKNDPSELPFFTGPTGTGCDHEYGPEGIFITHPVAGTYTLELFPSFTFFNNKGLGCLAHSPPQPTTFNVDICNTLPCNVGSPNQISGDAGQGCVGTSITTTTTGICFGMVTVTLSINPDGVITLGQSTTGVPEFPVYGMTFLISMAVILIVIMRLFSVGKQQWARSNLRANSTIRN